MRHISHKWKVAIVFAVTGLVVFYVEILSYIINSRGWVSLPSSTNEEEPLKILIVADPQIQGERDEHKYLGVFTRWDADSYLKRTFNLARHHVKPHVIIYLGDLFDEGSKASDAEYKRYYARFANIFDVPRLHQSSTSRYIFIPGDNDVGGEQERISDEKLAWFNSTFGGYNGLVSVEQKNWQVQFMKYNLFFPQHLRQPLNGLRLKLNKDGFSTYRILLTHYPLLKFVYASVQEVSKSLKMSLVLSAHSHLSEYRRLEEGEGNSLHTTVVKKFLMSESAVQSTRPGQDDENNNDIEASMTSKYFRFHIDETPSGQMIHEISVPTCSYRMGVPNMGYGSMQIFQDGTVHYTVLWLPSRFSQLTIYQVYFILMKLVTSPYFYWKFFKFALGKYRDYKQRKSKASHSV